MGQGIRKKKTRRKTKKLEFLKGPYKVWWIAGICVGAGVLSYLGVSLFFTNHFYINTKINGKDFSGKSVQSVEKYLESEVDGYELTILEKDGNTDTISGQEISLKYQKSDEIESALKKQNAFLWPKSLFSKKTEKISIQVSYDEAALNQKIQTIQAVSTEQIPAQNARPEYNGETYFIQKETYGTAVDMEVLNQKIHEYISEFKHSLDMEQEQCYAKPRFTSESPEVQAAVDLMNRCITASITYPMKEQVVVDKALITQWLTVDENMNVTFQNDAMKAWFTQFGDLYDTQGTTRSLVTPAGKTTTVTGGTYGWSIDEDTELIQLQNSIKNGEVITREPAYYAGGIAASHSEQDWGTTFIEVDLSAQHMWYIQNGEIALETDVVTGVPIPEKITPEGVYSILEMSEDETLVGEIVPETGKSEYETPVDYWMRVTWSGIGFHDAIWQPAFGGSLNQDPDIGSHGCINMPLSQAAALYGLIRTGTPVVIHY